QDGWQQPLADALAAEPSLSRSARLGRELAPGLRAFAASAWRGRLAAAADVWREVEFLLAWPLDGGTGPTIRGCIDLLWRNGPDDWHLLAWDFGPAGRDPWRGRKPGLLAQAWAVARQVGAWPRSVSLFNLASAAAVSTVPRESSARTALRTLFE